MRVWTRGGSSVSYAEVRSWGRVRVAAGGPVGGDAAAAARQFEADAHAAGARVLWFGLETLAEVGPDRPALVIGAEPVWRAGRWPEIVQSKRSVRAQIRRATHKGVTVEAWSTERVQRSAVLREVLDAWLGTRGLPPLAFLASPYVLDARDRQVWVASVGAQVVGYLALRPGPEVLLEWIIQRPDAPNGTASCLVDRVMRSLPPASTVTLGLVPLSQRAPLSDAQPSLGVRALLAWTRAHATRFYNFEGLERFKAKFVPDQWRPLYLATDGRPITVVTFHAVAAAFASPRSPTRFVARALADALADELRGAGSWLQRRA